METVFTLFAEPVAAAVERETGETRSWLEVSAVAGGGLRVALKPAALALRGHPGHTHCQSARDTAAGFSC